MPQNAAVRLAGIDFPFGTVTDPVTHGVFGGLTGSPHASGPPILWENGDEILWENDDNMIWER